MNRRAFVTGLGAVPAAPVGAEAQQAAEIWRIGFVGGSRSTIGPFIQAFEQRLRELGYVDGQNIAIVFLKDEQSPRLTAELVRLKIDVLVAATTQPALAAGQAPERFTRATLDEMNAQHARDHAHCTRAETIALLEKSGASTAAVLRGLSDEQLAKRGTVLTDAPPLTVEQLIALVLIKHADQHFGSIRKTIGRLLESA